MTFDRDFYFHFLFFRHYSNQFVVMLELWSHVSCYTAFKLIEESVLRGFLKDEKLYFNLLINARRRGDSEHRKSNERVEKRGNSSEGEVL